MLGKTARLDALLAGWLRTDLIGPAQAALEILANLVEAGFDAMNPFPASRNSPLRDNKQPNPQKGNELRTQLTRIS